MQNKQAIFIIGNPGSGKDVVIRDITSNYNIVEFASSQIDEMLSNDSAFKRATDEKKDALLERNSILVTGNSFNLNFILTKELLESIGYSTYLILVEASLDVSIDRLRNRPNLTESLNRITLGNANKQSIFDVFESLIVVDNSHTLNLSECREYISGILNELSFKSNLTLEDIKKPVLKKTIKSKIVPLDFVDTRGSTSGVWSVSPGITSESLDYPMSTTTPIATGPLQQIKTNGSDMRSDQDKERARKVLGKLKQIKNIVIPNGID